ncbi:sporulation integral membrane protein YlbJ [Proteinivorax hydrogeniformans]|uniref:Sporulation integral membrane protein YlbJ n=1 Tax=Proteinivorax hydrogeniformans TaxID=1826727 RepID=A0AAU8HPF1_9FIRM
MYRKNIMVYGIALFTTFMAISMVLFPENAFESALEGLNLWWNVVFPALLPFFMVAQLLIGLGAVHFMGVLLEPFMRPVFNVPGSGGFVMAVGLASGFPLGSVLTADVRKKNLINKTEGERLVSFTNTADPLFMFGAVAVGMLGRVEMGILIAVAHYLSSISVGIIMRFYKMNAPKTVQQDKIKRNILIKALLALKKGRDEDGRSFGKLLGDSAKKSVNTLLVIGAFIVMFSVMIEILLNVGVIDLIANALLKFLGPLGVNFELLVAYISGIFEVTLGCQKAAEAAMVSPTAQMVAISFIIAFSGLSVTAQVASMIGDTDISIKPFIIARIIHGFLAGLYTYLLVKFGMFKLVPQAIPAFFAQTPSFSIDFLIIRFVIFSIPILLMLLVILAFLIYKTTKLVAFRVK